MGMRYDAESHAQVVASVGMAPMFRCAHRRHSRRLEAATTYLPSVNPTEGIFGRSIPQVELSADGGIILGARTRCELASHPFRSRLADLVIPHFVTSARSADCCG